MNNKIKQIVTAPENLFCVYDVEDENGNLVREAFKVYFVALFESELMYPVVRWSNGFEIETGETANYIGMYTISELSELVPKVGEIIEK